MESRDVFHRIEQGLPALFAEADERDVDFVRAIGVGGAKDVGCAEDKASAGTGDGFGKEVPAADGVG